MAFQASQLNSEQLSRGFFTALLAGMISEMKPLAVSAFASGNVNKPESGCASQMYQTLPFSHLQWIGDQAMKVSIRDSKSAKSTGLVR